MSTFLAIPTGWAGKFQRTKGKHMVNLATAWQPIETAPKDGTEILAVFASDYGGTQDKPTIYGPWTAAFRRNKWMASWDDASVIEREGYWGTDYLETPLEPTHWMPLPQPPEVNE